MDNASKMEISGLSAGGVPRAPNHSADRGVQRPGDAAAKARAEQSHVDGVRWTHQSGAGRILNLIPPGAWANPSAAGWLLVKSNPRRDVWRAEVAGQGFYVKYYFSQGWLRRTREGLFAPAYASEWRSGLYALRRRIPAVIPIACAERVPRDGRTCAVLVTEAFEPATPLHEFWRQLQSDPRGARRRADAAQLVDRLGELIARAHQAGFEHTDMHAANILVQTLGPRQYRCAFVDLHSARRGDAIQDQAVLRNLAQLNQWFRRHSSLCERVRFLRAYLRWRDEFEIDSPHGRALGLDFSSLFRALADAAERHARALWAQRDRRDGRNGRYFARASLARGWRGNFFVQTKHPSAGSLVSRRTLEPTWWVAQVTPILQALNRPDARLAKDSHSARVVRHTLDHPAGPVEVILKRPRARNWRRALVQSLPPSRARRAWEMGNALLNRDVPTARPLALLEQRASVIVQDSVLVVEVVAGALDLEAHLRSEHPRCSAAEWLAHKKRLARVLVSSLRQLEDRRIYHRDCKAGNILIVSKPELAAVWIDLDGMRMRKRALTVAERLAPLARLHASLLQAAGLTRTDRVRFLKDYCARFGASPDAWRQAWRTLEPIAQRKRAATVAHRAWKKQHYGRE